MGLYRTGWRCLRPLLPIAACVSIAIAQLPVAANPIELVPKVKKVVKSPESASAEVGTGWSIKEDPRAAVREAVAMALEGKAHKEPDFAMIIANSGSDMAAIFSEARNALGARTKLYGGTSDPRGLVTDKGFIDRGCAVMTVTSKDIIFGAAAVDFSKFSSASEATKAALASAAQNAAKPLTEMPKMILVIPTLGKEEDVLKGIEEVFGKSMPVLGGTAGGPQFNVMGPDAVYAEGVSLALIYTDLPVGWSFEIGLEPQEMESGVITKVLHKDAHTIVLEIDNKPAWDIYNEWLKGEPRKLYEKDKHLGALADYSALHPMFRKLANPNGGIHYFYTHPLVNNETIKNGSFELSQRFESGERLYLTSGTWEMIVNTISNIPRRTNLRGDIKRPIFSIGVICRSLLGSIPQSEREKIPVLINYTNQNAPFIAYFAWGEQGHFVGIGNKQANLMIGFLTIGDKE